MSDDKKSRKEEPRKATAINGDAGYAEVEQHVDDHSSHDISVDDHSIQDQSIHDSSSTKIFIDDDSSHDRVGDELREGAIKKTVHGDDFGPGGQKKTVSGDEMGSGASKKTVHGDEVGLGATKKSIQGDEVGVGGIKNVYVGGNQIAVITIVAIIAIIALVYIVRVGQNTPPVKDTISVPSEIQHPVPDIPSTTTQPKSTIPTPVIKIPTDNRAPSFQVNYVYRPGGVGELRPIRNNEVLNSGDHYKIIFTPDKDCYVYIFQIDSSDQIFRLFPMESFKGVEVNNFNPVRKGNTYSLPSAKKAFRLDRQVGLERFYFIISKEKNREIAELYNDLLRARKRSENLQIANTQDKLKTLFKRRGPAEIVDDKPVQISWEDNLFTVIGQKLENIREDCVHVLEFKHQ